MAEVKIEKGKAQEAERGSEKRGSERSMERSTERRTPSSAMSRRNQWWPSALWRNPFEPLTLGSFGMLRRLSDEMDRAFGSLRSRAPEEDMAEWWPAIEVKQRNGNLVVCAQLSGVKKDDVKVEIDDDTMTIQGERNREHEEEAEGSYRSEWAYGSFCRCVALPEGAQTEKARAEFKDGVLEVSIPVPETRKSREIPIQSAA